LETIWKGKEIIPENSNKGWKYVTGPDTTTHGLVTYVGDNTAKENFSTTDNNLIIKLKNNPGNSINSIRLTTTNTYDSGLFIIDLNQIPYGKYIWPAFWLLGDYEQNNAWSYNGEIDIIEGGWQIGGGINATNQSTLHTNTKSGSLPCNQEGVVNMKPPEGGYNCTYNPNYGDIKQQPGEIGPNPCINGDATDKTPDCCGENKQQTCPFNGCGYKFNSALSYGEKFKKNGGGIYACELTDDGYIRIWFWSRINKHIPDLKNNIDITNWENTADERIIYNPCPKTFSKMRMIINTTACGDAFDHTGREQCNTGDLYQLIQKDEFIKNSSWDINFISIYNKII